MDFILLFIIIIYSENLIIKIQYAANNPGVIFFHMTTDDQTESYP